MSAKSFQLCPTLCNPTDCNPPGSVVHGILRQEYWSGFPRHLPGDPSNPGIEPMSLCLLDWKEGSLPQVPPGEPIKNKMTLYILSLRQRLQSEERKVDPSCQTQQNTTQEGPRAVIPPGSHSPAPPALHSLGRPSAGSGVANLCICTATFSPWTE